MSHWRARQRNSKSRTAARLLVTGALTQPLGCTDDPRIGAPEQDGAQVPGDAAPGDAAPGDAAPGDAATHDAALGDAAVRDGGVPGVDAAPEAGPGVSPPGLEFLPALPDNDSEEPFYLSQTGLYVDPNLERLSADILEFTPRHALWSDGAEKRRFLRVPAGAVIDTSDMTSWTFPVGTFLWKQFTRDGVRVETRLIARTGTGERDYWMGAFLWNEDESDARFVPDGQVDARGTPHDVPTATQCGTCHNGERGRALGVSAVQLAGAAPLGLDDLALLGWLSHPPEDAALFGAPGEPHVAAALGYLHGNCGHCHNPRGSARPDTDLDLRLLAGERVAENTPAVQSTLDVPLQNFMDTTLTTRVVPGDPELSALLFRMTERGTRTQMPPLATEQVDPEGVDLVRRWIEAL